MANQDICEDDLMIVSYPRSGNTWVRFFLAHLIFPDVNWDYKNLSYIIPDVYNPIVLDKTGTVPRMLKSHEIYNCKYKRVLYLFRDPRDVVLSFYDYSVKVRRKTYSFDEFFELFLKGETLFGKWDDHVNSWFDADVNIRVISYEVLCYNSLVAFDLIARFVGLECSKEEIGVAIEKSSFNRYQKHIIDYVEKVNGDKSYVGGVSGSFGKWKNVLTVKQNEEIIEAFGDTMKRVGYLEE